MKFAKNWLFSFFIIAFVCCVVLRKYLFHHSDVGQLSRLSQVATQTDSSSEKSVPRTVAVVDQSKSSFRDQRQTLLDLMNSGRILELMDKLQLMFYKNHEADAAAELAMIYRDHLHDPRSAKQWLRKAINLNPNFSQAVDELFYLHQADGTLVSEFLPFLEQELRTAAIDSGMALLLLQLGRTDEACELLLQQMDQLDSSKTALLASLYPLSDAEHFADQLWILAFERFESQASQEEKQTDRYYRPAAIASLRRLGAEERAIELESFSL